MDGRDQVHRGKRRRAPGLQRVVGAVDGLGQPIIPGQPQEIGKLSHHFRRKGGFSGAKPFGGQKHPAGGAGIVTSSRQQKRVPQRGLILAAAHQPDRDGGAFQGLAGAPAAGPGGRGADKIVQRFQGDAGGEGGGKIVGLAATRQGPAGQGSDERRSGNGRGDGRIHGRRHKPSVRITPELYAITAQLVFPL